MLVQKQMRLLSFEIETTLRMLIACTNFLDLDTTTELKHFRAT